MLVNKYCHRKTLSAIVIVTVAEPLYFSGYTYYYGSGQGPIILDDVECRGDESSLLDCSHLPIGSHDCSYFENAGVYCHGNKL